MSVRSIWVDCQDLATILDPFLTVAGLQSEKCVNFLVGRVDFFFTGSVQECLVAMIIVAASLQLTL